MSVAARFRIPYGRQTIEDDDLEAVKEVLFSDLLTTGPKTREFEEAICDYTGAKYCVALSNGTAALHLSSLALLREGDLVLTTPNSFVATSNAILYAKAKPIFVDIGEDGNIDLDLCEEELRKNPNIKALFVVSFSGRMVDQERLAWIRNRYGVKILEDNAHAIGAFRDGVKAGSCQNSDIGIFSFHPVKNMTTGEGGAITTNSKEIYEKLLTLRTHGIVKTDDMAPWEYEMRELGFNYRITDFQSALGISQLKKLDSFLQRRRELAKRYCEYFKGSSVRTLYGFDKGSAYHLFVVRVKYENKRELYERLISRGVGVQLHYIPINKQPYYKSLGYEDAITPNMDRYFEEALSLPIYPKLSNSEQDYVIEVLLDLLDE
jgi:UDP-4-amino-4,6-dideoxy-N-acetyl-beta-L-altrosamine transaminase